MKKLNLKLYESSTPPEDTNVLWVDIDEDTNKLKSIQQYNQSNGEWDSILEAPKNKVIRDMVGYKKVWKVQERAGFYYKYLLVIPYLFNPWKDKCAFSFKNPGPGQQIFNANVPFLLNSQNKQLPNVSGVLITYDVGGFEYAHLKNILIVTENDYINKILPQYQKEPGFSEVDLTDDSVDNVSEFNSYKHDIMIVYGESLF